MVAVYVSGNYFVSSKTVAVSCNTSVFSYCFVDDEIKDNFPDRNELRVINSHHYRQPIDRILEIKPNIRSYIASITSVFEDFPNLEALYISNSLDAIPLLQRAKSLKKLNFRRNFIRVVKENSFSEAQQIEEINLSENSLRTVEDRAFSGLDNIQTITLSKNNITALSNETFVGVDSIEFIDLRSNAISSIKDGCFNLTNLKELVLSFNRLQRVTVGMFAGADSLEKLMLGHNLIKFIDLYEIGQSSPIQWLDLEYNELGLYDGFTNSSIIKNLVEHNLSLKQLNLANNQLKNPQILDHLRCFENLETLNVINNNLTHLENVVDLKVYFPHIAIILISDNKLKCDWLQRNAFDTSVFITVIRRKKSVKGIACL